MERKDRGRQDMGFLSVFGYNLISGAVSLSGAVCVGMLVLKMLSPGRRKLGPGRVAMAAVWLVACALLATFLYKTGLLRHIPVDILLQYVQLAGNSFCIVLLFRERFRLCWDIVVFEGIVMNFSVMFCFVLLSDRPLALSVQDERRRYLFTNYMLAPAVFGLFLFLLYKMKVGDVYRRWMNYGGVWKRGMICLSAYPILTMGLTALFSVSGLSRNGSMAVAFLLVFAALLIFHYMGQEEWQRKEAAARQLILQQQENYIRTLEGMQEEMRRFRHDYKNMLSGMYLTAKEGELSKTLDYIRDMTEDFDSQIGGQIRQMSQLGNVCVTEIRGLLLVKIGQMQKESTACELEVMRPFHGADCRITDLCRCLSVLIDNAADEVRGRDGARVDIMISCQEGYTTFRVKNRLYHNVDVHRIWQQGYSTRGAERGIGLASYRKIVDSYENLLAATAVQEGYFVQELKIQDRNAE